MDADDRLPMEGRGQTLSEQSSPRYCLRVIFLARARGRHMAVAVGLLARVGPHGGRSDQWPATGGAAW